MHTPNALERNHHSRSNGFQSISQAVLRVESLVKIYGKRRVVDGVSFYVNKGEIVGLLGPNGAGKTTSFRMTCGLIGANGGSVYLGAHDITNWPMYRRSREGGMGYLPQEKSVFQKLSVQNNLYGVMEMIGIRRAERRRRCDELLEKFGLTHIRRNLGGGLSGGERRRLEIARALVSKPKIILLDEPFAAIDPITVAGIQEIIKSLSAEGISILITDHSAVETLQTTQRSYVIEAGQVICHGTPIEVLDNPRARKAYFGENVSIAQIQSTSGIIPPEKFTVPASIGPSTVSLTAPSTVSSPVVPVEKTSAPRVQHPSQNVNQSGVRTRTMGKRLTPSVPVATHHHQAASGRPLVQSHSEGTPPSGSGSISSVSTSSAPPKPSAPISKPATMEPEENAPGSSGVIRKLGTLIWGR